VSLWLLFFSKSCRVGAISDLLVHVAC